MVKGMLDRTGHACTSGLPAILAASCRQYRPPLTPMAATFAGVWANRNTSQSLVRSAYSKLSPRFHRNMEDAHLWPLLRHRKSEAKQYQAFGQPFSPTPRKRLPDLASIVFILTANDGCESLSRAWQQAMPPKDFAEVRESVRPAEPHPGRFAERGGFRAGARDSRPRHELAVIRVAVGRWRAGAEHFRSRAERPD
jgi:hypothetical protein